MTAYLKPGDKIFFCYPGNHNPRIERENVDSIKNIFSAAGIETIGTMGIMGQGATFEIVAVIRDEQ